jgi:hypothetical protein
MCIKTETCADLTLFFKRATWKRGRDAVPDRLNKRIRGRFELADQSADPDRDTLRGVAGRKRHADYADPFGDRALRKGEPLFARFAHPLKDVGKIHALPTGGWGESWSVARCVQPRHRGRRWRAALASNVGACGFAVQRHLPAQAFRWGPGNLTSWRSAFLLVAIPGAGSWMKGHSVRARRQPQSFYRTVVSITHRVTIGGCAPI